MAKKKNRTSRRQRYNTDELTQEPISTSSNDITPSEIKPGKDPNVLIQHEPRTDTLYDFLNNPNKDTVMRLSEYEIEILHVISNQVEKDVVQDITLQFANGRRMDINSKLSKQILNYISGFRVKCDFGKCKIISNPNIREPYKANNFFSMEECKDKCEDLSVLPSTVVDMIAVQYLDNVVLDNGGVRLINSGLQVSENQFDLITKIKVDLDSRYTRFDARYLSQFRNLTKLILGNHFDYPIDGLDLPKLTYIHTGNSFNRPVDVLNNFRELTLIELGERFNKTLVLHLPELERLELGDRFNSDINFELPKLTHLLFGENFDRVISDDNVSLPSLTHLRFGNMFSRSLDDLDLRNLVVFSAGQRFNHHMNNMNLPNLEYMELGNELLYGEIEEFYRDQGFRGIRSYNRILEYNPTMKNFKELVFLSEY